MPKLEIIKIKTIQEYKTVTRPYSSSVNIRVYNGTKKKFNTLAKTELKP